MGPKHAGAVAGKVVFIGLACQLVPEKSGHRSLTGWLSVKQSSGYLIPKNCPIIGLQLGWFMMFTALRCIGYITWYSVVPDLGLLQFPDLYPSFSTSQSSAEHGSLQSDSGSFWRVARHASSNQGKGLPKSITRIRGEIGVIMDNPKKGRNEPCKN